MTLYRFKIIKKDEIQKIKEYLKNKKDNIPGAICFSKAFLSFTKDRNIANDFYEMNKKKINDMNIPVFFILDKNEKMNNNLATHIDIIDISSHPDEKEILFLPFSSFEIKDIRETDFNLNKCYEIKLSYLGTYENKLKNIQKEEIIPDSLFKDCLIKSDLFEEKTIKNITNKKIINEFEQYTKKKRIQ